jgi:streptogramin lyase
VVVIHGIGNQKRNSTLVEAVNALTFWFNHHAGLELRSKGTGPAGAGRVWLTTELRDDDDPDAEASCATLRLVAPSDGASGQGAPSTDTGTQLRLEFREVWWAESFGIPKVGAALAWARVQFREQLAHLLLPAGFSLGPAQIARRAPAHEIAQALTYQPKTSKCPTDAVAGDDGSAHGTSAPAGVAPPAAKTRRRFWRGVGLWLYDLVQYLWKLAQWLVLTPLISVLLVLLGLVRLLARIPLLQWSLVASATALINSVVLHWVASMQVYLLDYSRSAAMRQRFEREVQDFLDDPQCTRIVVIAHSMGTVISYEGLTTLLAEPEWQARAAGKQQITYICLAQALRRVWLLSRTDPERLRGVLPAGVRWLHFWARYDPVAVGPLYPDALPLPDPGASAAVQDADKALRARLDCCENVDVVNTDSIYSDHTTYWDNLEQVVGPIAHELVAGSPALERLVARCLASREEVLKRRWKVAWRALASLAGGFGLAAVLVALDARNGGRLSQAIAGFIGGILGSAPVQSFLDLTTFHLSTVIGNAISQCFSSSGACAGLHNLGQNPYFTFPYLFSSYLGGNAVTTATVALGLLGLSILLVGKLVAEPSPFAFRGASAEAAGTRSVFVLAMATLLVTLVSLLVYRAFQPKISDARHLSPAGMIYVWGIGLGEVAWLAALGMSLLDALRARRWGWLVGLPSGSLLALVAAPFYAIAAAAVALLGCLVLAIEAARRRRWGWVAGLALVALPLGAAVGNLLHTQSVGASTFGTLVIAAPLAVYGLWTGPAQIWSRIGGSGAERGALGLAAMYLALSAAGSLIWSTPQIWVPLTILATFLGAIAWGLSLADAARAHRWSWAVGMVLITVLLSALTHGHSPSGQLFPLLGQFSLPAGPWLVWSVPFVAAALCYMLWAERAPRPLTAKTARRNVPALLSGLTRVATAAAIVALLISLLSWDVISAIRMVPNSLVFAQLSLGGPLNGSSGSDRSKLCPPPPLPCSTPSGQNGASSQAPLLSDITVGPDGNLWFTDKGTGKIGRITPKGAISEFPLPDASSQPYGITKGPDGNLWFTDFLMGKIGRFTPQGTLRNIQDSIQEFSLSRESGPGRITLGPDGSLWFTEATEAGRSAIGCIIPTGTLQDIQNSIHEFHLPNAPEDITAGPDHNLWFTVPGPDTIGRVTPKCSSQGIQDSIHEFPLPYKAGYGSQPSGITAGPDGNLWFTEYASNAIGSITPTGTIQDIQRSIKEFVLPDSDRRPFSAGPTGITKGPDGNLWYADYLEGKIGRIIPTGSSLDIQLSLQEFDLPTDAAPDSIVAGPDGNLWFTDNGQHNASPKIGYITTGGAIQQFGIPTLPSEVSEPAGITAGPDGNLWFTDNGTGMIGQITPAGNHQEFPLPDPYSGPTGITAGPDGNLWFTEKSGIIGRITPTGSSQDIRNSIQEFPLPDRGSWPTGITAGPDGNLWFTEYESGTIGRITPTGTAQEIQESIQEYSIPYFGSAPLGITAGRDGNLWFTDYTSGAIGRITPTGSSQDIQESIQEYSVPCVYRDGTPCGVPAQPYGITAGSDGNLWFTETNADKIGRITPTGSSQEIQNSIQELAVPAPYGPECCRTTSYGIAAAPDGNLWFTEYYAGTIGRITPQGSIQNIQRSLRQFTVPEPTGGLADITAGPDGNLWFTAVTLAGPGAIGRMVTWLADRGVGAG